jgi:hypothetical protein
MERTQPSYANTYRYLSKSIQIHNQSVSPNESIFPNKSTSFRPFQAFLTPQSEVQTWAKGASWVPERFLWSAFHIGVSRPDNQTKCSLMGPSVSPNAGLEGFETSAYRPVLWQPVGVSPSFTSKHFLDFFWGYLQMLIWKFHDPPLTYFNFDHTVDC